MRRFALIALLGCLAAPLANGDPREASALSASTTPVLVELFTSEGCSSCPPADRLLAELSTTQPISGALVIALGEHVDYWDDLGWPDRFSSPLFTARQSESQHKAFGSGTIYTPQIVVDGVLEAVGSDRAAVQRAIAQAARARKGALQVTPAPVVNGRLPVTIDVGPSGSRERADLIVAVVEDDLSTNVERGENRGRELTHTAVVRRLSVVRTLAPGEASAEVSADVPLDAGWHIDKLRVVAFVQARQSRKVWAVAAAPAVAEKTSG